MATSRSKIVKDLDAAFSRYIRLRAVNLDGYCECYTCGRSYEWKKIQCGHFMSRRHYSTRWDEENVSPQCMKCNMYSQGEQFLFSKYIDSKYGEGYSEVLMYKSRETVKFSDFELEEMITDYKEKLKDLEKSKI